MDLLALATEGYRWLVGIALIVFTYHVLKRIFQRPFKDEFALDEPDYMVKFDWKKRS